MCSWNRSEKSSTNTKFTERSKAELWRILFPKKREYPTFTLSRQERIYILSTMRTADVVDVTTDVEVKAPILPPNLLLFMITTRKWVV